jgi:predicted hydrocarbon binding protein
MDGTLLAALEEYVDEQYGDASWMALLDEAGIGPKEYRRGEQVPDTDLTAIVRAVPAITPVPLSSLAEDFGRCFAAELWTRYRHLARPEWRMLDILENVESIYVAVGASLFGSALPVLRGVRSADAEVTLLYASPRRLCALVKGVTRGIAAALGENVQIVEKACMLAGAPACEIVVRAGP